jgi:hypothetical protein
MENNLVAFFFLGLSRLVEEDSLAVLGTTALRRIGGHRECRLREGLSAHLGVNHVNLSNQITRCFVLFSTTYRLTRRLPHLLHAANKHTLLLWTSSSSDNWTACAATIDLLQPSRWGEAKPEKSCNPSVATHRLTRQTQHRSIWLVQCSSAVCTTRTIPSPNTLARKRRDLNAHWLEKANCWNSPRTRPRSYKNAPDAVPPRNVKLHNRLLLRQLYHRQAEGASFQSGLAAPQQQYPIALLIRID